MQPPTKSTERWQGKAEFMAQETLEDKIDLWFKVSHKYENTPNETPKLRPFSLQH